MKEDEEVHDIDIDANIMSDIRDFTREMEKAKEIPLSVFAQLYGFLQMMESELYDAARNNDALPNGTQEWVSKDGELNYATYNYLMDSEYHDRLRRDYDNTVTRISVPIPDGLYHFLEGLATKRGLTVSLFAEGFLKQQMQVQREVDEGIEDQKLIENHSLPQT